MSSSWLPWLLRWCCSESEDSEIRICEFSAATAFVCYLVSFFLFSEFTSGLDALHTVPNSGFVHTLPKEQALPAQQILFSWSHDPCTRACKDRPSFYGCRTSLSVSLSLSLSLSTCLIAKRLLTMVKLGRPCTPWCLALWPMTSSRFDWKSAS